MRVIVMNFYFIIFSVKIMQIQKKQRMDFGYGLKSTIAQVKMQHIRIIVNHRKNHPYSID